jgi:hypothetical protein
MGALRPGTLQLHPLQHTRARRVERRVGFRSGDGGVDSAREWRVWCRNCIDTGLRWVGVTQARDPHADGSKEERVGAWRGAYPKLVCRGDAREPRAWHPHPRDGVPHAVKAAVWQQLQRWDSTLVAVSDACSHHTGEHGLNVAPFHTPYRHPACYSY